MDHIQLIKALIVFGADVEMHNDLGETPGLIAARSSKGNWMRRWSFVKGRVDEWETSWAHVKEVVLWECKVKQNKKMMFWECSWFF